MKTQRWCVLLVLALFLKALPAFGGGCPGEFVPAAFPELLPVLAENVCPTSANIGSGARLIQQDFEIKGVAMKSFVEGYKSALIEKGWKDPKMAEMGRVTSLQSAHPDGFKLQIVLNDLNLTALQSPSNAPPLTRAKVILQKSP